MKRAGLFVVFLSVTILLAVSANDATSTRADPTGLIAHEWGTFTTVAGADGRPVDWLPLGAPQDLPCFVDRYVNGGRGKGLPRNLPALTYEAARAHLPGKVRMETPVIYFYSPRPLTADVRVQFRRGVLTEWYPRADVTQWDVNAAALDLPDRVGTIAWRNVRVAPGAGAPLPSEPGDSHYYAARDTDAAPVTVGGQHEKFLFYRGVGGFDVPLSAVLLPDGRVRVRNEGTRELGGVMVVENRGGRIAFRAHGALRGDATIDAPAAADPAQVRAALERTLVEAGLYPKEARAMVATWRDSWLEPGARVFYVLAPAAVDDILPLAIDPAPVEIARVFVGRAELVTTDALAAVRAAIDARDAAALERHGRLLGPIADRLTASATSPAERGRIRDATSAAFAAYLARGTSCR